MQPESSRISSDVASARSNIRHHIGFSSLRWKSTKSAREPERASGCFRKFATASCRAITAGDNSFVVEALDPKDATGRAKDMLLSVASFLSHLHSSIVDLQSSLL